MSLIQAYRRFVVLLAKFLFTIYIRKFEVVGREHVPLEGPLILASNHVNNVDPPAITLAVPRFPMFMAKQAMTTWPILGPAIRAASEVVNEGNMVVMFPEGTRSRTGGLTKGHPGTALIALRTGAPILPVAVTGTETIAWPWLFIKPLSIKHVKVTIGEPFRLPPVERIDGDAAAAATGVIMRRIAALLPPQHRGVYADIEGETTPAETD